MCCCSLSDLPQPSLFATSSTYPTEENKPMIAHRTQLDSHDADLLTRIGIAMTLSRRPAFQKLHLVVYQRGVTLSGELPSYHERQLAVELVRRIAGVLRVHDQIVVSDELVEPYASFAEPSAASQEQPVYFTARI